MNTDSFANPLSSTELRNIRREAEALRAAYLRSLFRRLAGAFSRPGTPANGGLTAAR